LIVLLSLAPFGQRSGNGPSRHPGSLVIFHDDRNPRCVRADLVVNVVPER
jgi:hypothetical protein